MNTRLKLTVYLIVTTTGIQCLGINKVSAQTKTNTKTTTIHHVVIKKAITKKPSAVELAMGKALFQKSDCLTCHKLDVKLVGPAYYDVAKKYPATDANYEMLANKVIAGGSGVWGQVAMAPHPALTHADAKKIVEYVLSLKPGKS
jgi:cytochrome c